MVSAVVVLFAVSTGVVVIVVAAAVVLVVLIVAVSMRGVRSVARSGAVRLGVTSMRPESERGEQSASAMPRAGVERTWARTGSGEAHWSRTDNGCLGQAAANG
jgi:type II secretory pathway component PulK